MAVVLERSEMRRALAGLHRRRRVQRLRHLDWIDALYRAYVVGIVLVAALAVLAAIVGDGRLAASTVDEITRRGPAIVGAFAALLVAFGLRSGAQGGPLAFEAPDVQHVLLAPIERGIVVRSAALRQVRGVVTMGAVAGAMAGAVAGPRFSDHGSDTVGWVLACGAFGVLAALGAWGSALLASSTRLHRGHALLAGSAVVAWSVADATAGTTTSPLTMLGHLALVPIVSSTLVAVGVVAVLGLVGAGFANGGRMSLEPVLRRAQLVRALRFAATVQDLRAVITLRRQLAHEQSRTRPWFRLRPAPPTGRATWRRDWHGILRWPGARVARVVVLTVVTGAACAGALRGTTPLLAVGPVAAYVIALDVVEGLAQDIDHPDRSSGVPMVAGERYTAHLAAPFALMGAIGLAGLGVGMLVAALVPAGAHENIPVAAGLAVVVAVTALGPTAAALSVYLGRPDRDLMMLVVHPGIVAAQQFGPIVLLAIGFLPLLVARETRPADGPAVAAAMVGAFAVVVALGMRAFLRSRRSEPS
ncbi:MAG: hypothetical protein ACXVLO_04130 [Acidimicrobiia bacterium]